MAPRQPCWRRLTARPRSGEPQYDVGEPRFSWAGWVPGPGAVERRDELLPEVGPEDVQIRAVVSALSHGTEMLVYRGQVPPELEFDLPTLQGSFRFPVKYGYASVGRVTEVGAAVRT